MLHLSQMHSNSIFQQTAQNSIHLEDNKSMHLVILLLLFWLCIKVNFCCELFVYPFIKYFMHNNIITYIIASDQ